MLSICFHFRVFEIFVSSLFLLVVIATDCQYIKTYQQDFKKKIMMVFGACIFLAVAEPTGLNPLEIAGNIVSLSVICHFQN